MIEGSENKMDCRFIRNEAQAVKRISDPTMKSAVICSPNLAVTFHRKKVIHLNQQWAIGMSILEISKLIMMRRYHEQIKPLFPSRVSVCMSDTGWLVKEKKNEGQMYTFFRFFRAFDWGKSSGEGDRQNETFTRHFQLPPKSFALQRRIQKFSQQNEERIARGDHSQFCGREVRWDDISISYYYQLIYIFFPRAKSYAIQTVSGAQTLRAKGVKSAYRNKMKFEDYEKVIKDVTKFEITQHNLQSKNHVIRLVKEKRAAFSTLEDKR